MTYEDIIESIELCIEVARDIDVCEYCPLYNKCKYGESALIEAKKLINRQQAEIERLKQENNILSKNADTAFQDGLNEAQDLYAEQVKSEEKSEAIKEFARKLKCGVPQETGVIHCADVDKLVKEMVGED